MQEMRVQKYISGGKSVESWKVWNERDILILKLFWPFDPLIRIPLDNAHLHH